MGMVYFKSNDTLVTMDGETSIDVSRSNTVSTSSVMSTKQTSDDLLQGLLTVNIAGRVTYSKSATQTGNPDPSEWVDLIENAIANKERFTLYSVKYQSNQPLLKDYKNMVIADYGYVVDRFEDTITARVTFKEVFVVEAATTTYLAPINSSSTNSSYQSSTTDGTGTSTTVNEDDRSLIVAALEEAGTLVSGD